MQLHHSFYKLNTRPKILIILILRLHVIFCTVDDIFMPPHRKIGGILFYRCPSVRPYVRLSVCTNLTFSHYSYTNLVTQLIFGMKAHLIDTHLLVPRSSSSAKVKVKYQGHVSQKMGVSGALVFHKHILFLLQICLVFEDQGKYTHRCLEETVSHEIDCYFRLCLNGYFSFFRTMRPDNRLFILTRHCFYRNGRHHIRTFCSSGLFRILFVTD